MTRKTSIIALAIIVAGVIVVYNSAFTVKQTEQAVVTQFGKIIGAPISTPGLHFKAPLIQKTTIFPKTLLQWSSRVEMMPTVDKTFLVVGAFALWNIEEPVLFIQASGAKVETAEGFLEDILGAAIRNAVSSNTLVETVRNRARTPAADGFSDKTDKSYSFWKEVHHGRNAMVHQIILQARPKLARLGIRLADLAIDRLNYSQAVLPSVFEKMISERQRIAAGIKAQGQAEALRIQGEKQRDLKKITSAAYRNAQAVKGRADAAAARIYAAAYGQDPEFYWFYGLMDVYRNSFDADTTLLLSTDSEILKFLKHHFPSRVKPNATH